MDVYVKALNGKTNNRALHWKIGQRQSIFWPYVEKLLSSYQRILWALIFLEIRTVDTSYTLKHGALSSDDKPLTCERVNSIDVMQDKFLHDSQPFLLFISIFYAIPLFCLWAVGWRRFRGPWCRQFCTCVCRGKWGLAFFCRRDSASMVFSCPLLSLSSFYS